jgi:cytoskeletal protein RodZ
MNGFKHAGEELRRRRLELGLSLDDAFRKTRIAPAHLSAMEEGDLAGLPEPCFAAGFVRSYCQLLGLESERYVDMFRSATRSATRQREKRRARTVELGVLLDPKRMLPSWTGQAAAWLVICSIVALGWIAYTVAFQPSADPQANRAQASTLDMVVPPVTDESAR